MRRTMCAVLAICAAASIPATAGRTGRTTVHGRDGQTVKATLDHSRGRAYDTVKLSCGADTVQVLVNESRNTTIRINGQQYVLSPHARTAWSRGGWDALSANDQGKIERLLDLTNDPAAVIQAMIDVDNGHVPDLDALDTLYSPLAPGGCGIGGRCSMEAWAAMKNLISCAGSGGITALSFLGGPPAAGFFGGLLAFSNCADWAQAHDEFVRCCYSKTRPGDGDDDPFDDDPCDHCLPPDMPGPNPPCCYEDDPRP